MMDRDDCLMVLVAAAVLTLSGTAAAQSAGSKVLPSSANPAFANPDTPGLLAGKPSADVPNTTDIVFLKQFAIGGRAEVETGKLAGSKGEASSVQEYGKHMVKDHTDANGKLVSLARSAKVELPQGLDAEHAAARAELDKLGGKTFDIRYAEGQIKDHQKAAQLLIYVVGQGQHAGIRQYASDTLPVVMEHLERAQALHAELTGAGPPPKPMPKP